MDLSVIDVLKGDAVDCVVVVLHPSSESCTAFVIDFGHLVTISDLCAPVLTAIGAESVT